MGESLQIKYRDMVSDLLDNDNLNSWEQTFLDDIDSILYDENGFLTELQIEKLEEIYEKYNG